MAGDGYEVKPTVCFWCKAECGLLAHVSNGQLLSLEKDPDWPIKCYPPTKGCVRRKAAAEYFYHPGRVNFPLRRVGGRGEGRWRQVESVRKRHPDPIVRIHPATAAKEGIKEGDWAWIETRRGRVRQKVRIFDKMDPGIVDAEHGWWFPESPAEDPSLHGVFESNINVCMSDDPDHCNPEIGSYPLRTALCRISKAEPPPIARDAA